MNCAHQGDGIQNQLFSKNKTNNGYKQKPNRTLLNNNNNLCFYFFAVVAEAKLRESLKKKIRDKFDKLKKDKKKTI